MMLKTTVLLCFVPFCITKTVEVTFKNVTFRGYSLYTEKFKKTIPASNNLNEFLPLTAFDAIKFHEQNIPVLYENSLANLEDLDELVIEYCEVYEIRPGALKNVPLLRRLSLKGNRLEEIKKGVFNNLELSTLDLSSNSISIIDGAAFNDMPNILNINLADNEISTWNPDWFKNTPMLTRISMQNNSIENLPSGACKNLLGQKKFGSVDLTINLMLSHNKIKDIDPKAFSGLKKINNLWLDNNHIKHFDANLLNDIDVNDLRINNNDIVCFDGELSKIFKAGTTHIDSNPLDCDCVSKIKEWVDKNQKDVEFFYADMECSAQRIKNKLLALEKRLKEIKGRDGDIELVEEFTPVTGRPIK